MRWLLGFLLLLPVGASAQTMTWEALPNSALALVAPSPIPPGQTGIGAIVGAWNSAAYDTTRHQLLICRAGGHGDYAGNECYAFQHATQQFVRLTAPSGAAQWNMPSADVLIDGTPPAVHTYGGVAFDPVTDSLWTCGGSRWFDGNPNPVCFRWSVGDGRWVNLGTTMSASFPGQALMFQTTGSPWALWDAGASKILTVNRWVYAWIDQTTNKTIPVACSGISQGPNGVYNAVLDPVTRKLYVVGQGRTRMLDLSVSYNPNACLGGPVAHDVVLGTTGAKEIEGLYGTALNAWGGLGMFWDPIGKVVVAYGRSADGVMGRIYTLEPITATWRAWDAASIAPPRPSVNGMWNKLWLGPDACIYAVTDSAQPVWRTCTLPWRTDMTSYPVTIQIVGNGTAVGSGNYLAGSIVTLGASPNEGWAFAGFSGNALCQMGTFSMPANPVACTATFVPNKSFPFTVGTQGPGAGCASGSGMYTAGDTVTPIITPNIGSSFAGWTPESDLVCAPTFTMPARGVTCIAKLMVDSVSCQ